MAKASFNLSDFQSLVLKDGLARPNRFEVMIQSPKIIDKFSSNYRVVNLLCESAVFPPHIIGIKPQQIYGPQYQRPFGVEYGGEGIGLTFLLDTQLDVKSYFDLWMDNIVDPKEYYVHYEEDYATDIQIYQLDADDNITYTVKLEKAFPRSINLIDLNMGANNQTSKVNVNFAFRRWSASSAFVNRAKNTR